MGLFADSLISSSAFAKGDGGNIDINTNHLIIHQSGANINTVSNNSGNAGNVTIAATESVRVMNQSRLNSSVLPSNPVLRSILNLPTVSSGNGGNVTINTLYLLVLVG